MITIMGWVVVSVGFAGFFGIILTGDGRLLPSETAEEEARRTAEVSCYNIFAAITEAAGVLAKAFKILSPVNMFGE